MTTLPGRLLALDVGTKTVGVAVSDESRRLATPVETILRRGLATDVPKLAALATREQVRGIVVGLPLSLSGSDDNRSVRLARQVGEALARISGLPLAWQDERFSSVEAERRLVEGGRHRAERKERIDRAAAAVILQDFLDGPEGSSFAQASSGVAAGDVPAADNGVKQGP
jgi:putative holliday junction resolvase